MSDTPKGWHSRGYFPHFDAAVYQFVTFRLYDSLPRVVLRSLEFELRNKKLDNYKRAYRMKVEGYLDRGIGTCLLGRPDVAEVVQKALAFYDGRDYRLAAWVLMPNHVHILFRPNPDRSLSTIMKNLKGFTSREAKESWFDRVHFGSRTISTAS